MLADELIAVHEDALTVPPFTSRHPGLTDKAGYAAARALHQHRLSRGWKPLGRKIGFTNRTLWERYGVHEPMWGMVYDRTMLVAAGNRVTVPLAGLVQPRIEPEICFKLKHKPRESRDPQEMLAAIEWVAHSVEIVQCYHPGWKVTLADCTAANGLPARLCHGPPIPFAELPDLATLLPALEATLSKGDSIVDRGSGANVLGSPLL